MACLRDFELALKSFWRVEVGEDWITKGSTRLSGPRAFYKGWSGVSIRFLKGAFSFLSALLHGPRVRGFVGFAIGGLLLRRYYRILLASIAFANKDEDKGVFN